MKATAFIPFTDTPSKERDKVIRVLRDIPLPPTDICEEREVGWWCFWQGTHGPVQAYIAGDIPLRDEPKVRRYGGCDVVYQRNDMAAALRLSEPSRLLIASREGYVQYRLYRSTQEFRQDVYKECLSKGMSRAGVNAIFRYASIARDVPFWRYPLNLLPKYQFTADGFLQDVFDYLADGGDLVYHIGRRHFYLDMQAVKWWSPCKFRRYRLARKLTTSGAKRVHPYPIKGVRYWFWMVDLQKFDVQVPDLPQGVEFSFEWDPRGP